MKKSILGLFILIIGVWVQTSYASMCGAYLSASYVPAAFKSGLEEKIFWDTFLAFNKYDFTSFKQRGAISLTSDKFKFEYFSVITVSTAGPQLATTMSRRGFNLKLIKILNDKQKEMIRMYMAYAEATNKRLSNEEKSQLKRFYEYQKKFADAYSKVTDRGHGRDDAKKAEKNLLKVILNHKSMIESFRAKLPWD